MFMRMSGTRLMVGLILFATIGFLVAPLLVGPPGQMTGMYKIEDPMAVASPNGKYVATGFHAVESAAAHDSTVIQISPAQSSTSAEPPVFMVDNLGAFKVSWSGNNELVITYTPGPVSMQRFSWKGITIKYVQK
jgi:hypothetical protein